MRLQQVIPLLCRRASLFEFFPQEDCSHEYLTTIFPKRWIHIGLIALASTLLTTGAGPADVRGADGTSKVRRAAPTEIRLTLNEAIGIFLRQNLELLINRYEVEQVRASAITARLFPNPVLSLVTGGSRTQGRTLGNSSQLVVQAQQLFELAGKRGYRIQSAEYGNQVAEAAFEDAVRQLTLALKETYFHVQLAQRRLALAEENQGRFARVLEINTIRFNKGYLAEVELIRIRLQAVDFDTQVNEGRQALNLAQADLRQLLVLKPDVSLTLTTMLEYHRMDPDIQALRRSAIRLRPDIHAKRFAVDQQQAELRLANAYRIPDVVIGAGLAAQGPQGPDNPHQVALNLSLPLPIFNRNQGGIAQGEVALKVAEAELHKAINQAENEVEVAYHNFLQTRRLVDTYRQGVLEDAREAFRIMEQAYVRGGTTLLDLLDAARTSAVTQQDYLDALFRYLRTMFLLENAVGQSLNAVS